MHAYSMCMYVHACICWDVYVVNMQKYAVNVQAIQVLHTDRHTDTPMEPGDYKGEIFVCLYMPSPRMPKDVCVTHVHTY